MAYIAPNTHAQLESFYAVPQLGAVLVPINYRLTADDFAYIINHSGAKVVCAHADYLDAVDGIRDRDPSVEHFVALEGARDGWLDYERPARRRDARVPASPRSTRRDLLTINYTSGTTSRPKGVMITHRNAYMNVVGTLVHVHMTPRRPLPVDAADVPRQRLDVRLDRHRGGRRRTSACGASSRSASSSCISGEQVTMLCAAPTVLIGIANAPAELRRRRAARRARAYRRRAAGRGDDRAHRGRVRLGDHPRLRADRDGAVHHHLRAAPRARRALVRRSAR